MSQVLYPNPNATSRRSLAACVPPPPRKETTKEIQERSLKHIEEITKNLGPPQAEELTYEQQEWLEFRMARPFPKPYRLRPPIVISYTWQEEETDQ